MKPPRTLNEIVGSYRFVVDMTYCANHDAITGFACIADAFTPTDLVDADSPRVAQSLSQEAVSALRIGRVDSSNVAVEPIVRTPMLLSDRARYARNSPRGRNGWFLAHMCVVWLYQAWEDHYRGAVATALGVPRNSVKAPIFGDLRRLRNAIIHNLGVATPELARTEVLPPFIPGAPLYLGEAHVTVLCVGVHEYLDGLLAQQPNVQPTDG